MAGEPRHEFDLPEDPLFVEEVLRKLPNVVYIVDPRTHEHLFSNRDTGQLLGYSAAEIADIGFPNLIHPDDLGTFHRYLQRMHAITDDETSEVEYRARHKDGSWTWLRLRESVLSRDADGAATRMVGMVEDVTEHRQAEQELQQAHEQLEAAVMERTDELQREKAFFEDAIESMPGVFYVLDATGNFVRWNANMARITGHAEEGLAGVNALDIFADEERAHVAERIGMALAEGEAWAEANILSPDGPVPHFFSGKQAPLDGEPCLVGLGIDITDRRRAENERERLNVELARKNSELEQIVYVTSHDLRSPLVNVQGFSRELAASVDEIVELLDHEAIPAEVKERVRAIAEDDVAEAVGFVLSSIHKMDGLLAGLLRLSRIGRTAVRLEPVDMHDLMQQVLEDVEYRAKEADVDLSYGALHDCLGDRISLDQLFSNLVDNALKYLDPDRPGEIRIRSTADNGEVVYCVEDNGRGISEDYQEKIFEIFHRLEPDTVSGEGLGLTIVRRIVDKHDGRVWVESVPEQGARFFVSLPAIGVPASSGDPDRPTPESSRCPR